MTHDVAFRPVLNEKEVMSATGMSKGEILKLVESNNFPMPRDQTRRRLVWYADDVAEWSAMTPKQYRTAIKALKLSPLRAAIWLGVDRDEGLGYASGSARVPHPVRKLLHLMIKKKLAPKDVG